MKNLVFIDTLVFFWNKSEHFNRTFKKEDAFRTMITNSHKKMGNSNFDRLAQIKYSLTTLKETFFLFILKISFCFSLFSLQIDFLWFYPKQDIRRLELLCRFFTEIVYFKSFDKNLSAKLPWKYNILLQLVPFNFA